MVDVISAGQKSAELAKVFASLADLVYNRAEINDILEAVCMAAPMLVDGCDHASVMLRDNGKYSTIAASDEISPMVDALEREVADGPCVDAIEEESIQLDTDLRISPTWPELAERVLRETPVRGAAGFRLVIDQRKVAALNLFSDTPGELTAESVNQAIILTSFVSVALTAATQQHEATTLREGLSSNREIGKAVGLMMAYHKVSDQEAFDILRKASQDVNIRIIEVARQVVDHHNNRPLS